MRGERMAQRVTPHGFDHPTLACGLPNGPLQDRTV